MAIAISIVALAFVGCVVLVICCCKSMKKKDTLDDSQYIDELATPKNRNRNNTNKKYGINESSRGSSKQDMNKWDQAMMQEKQEAAMNNDSSMPQQYKVSLMRLSDTYNGKDFGPGGDNSMSYSNVFSQNQPNFGEQT